MPFTFNKRKPNQQQTSDSIAPPLYKNPLSLDPQSKSGFFVFQLLDKKSKKSKIANTVEGTVLEVLGDGQKVKYRILTQTPEINYEEGKDGYIEDYLIKVRTRNDIGTKTDPESILRELKETMSDAQKQEIRKKYLYAVAEHDTLAPKFPTSFFGQAPKQGDIVKIHYNNSLLDSGEEIKGFYEILNNNHDYFEKGEDAFLDLLKNFRKKYEETFKNINPASSDSKSPEVQNHNNNNEREQQDAVNTPVAKNTANLGVDEVIKAAGGNDKLSKYLSLLPPNSINAEIIATAFSYADGYGGSYKLAGQGVLEDIYHDGKIFMKNNGHSYCSGGTFTVAMKVINNRKLFSGRTRAEVLKFQQLWYGVKEPERQQGSAMEYMRIGRNIPLEQALPGDFIQIHRFPHNPVDGHSVLFLEWIEKDGQKIGFTYRASGSPSGWGNSREYFGNSNRDRGKMIRERTYVARMFDLNSNAPTTEQQPTANNTENGQTLADQGLPLEE